MTVATSAAPPPPPGPQRPFTVNEYHRMIQSGVLTEDDPVELLEGWVVFKMPRDPIHDATVDRTAEALLTRVGAGWRVRVQSAITTGDSEPEPDVAVAPGPASRYDARHPGPGDLILVAEIAGSSLDRDRDEKGRIYARAAIPVYWIVNLVDRRVEVYTDPSGPTATPLYRGRAVYGLNGSVPLNIPGQPPAAVPVRELLP